MLDTLELISMQFSKNGVVGTIEQEKDGRYKIQFENHVYYFSYEHFELMKDVMYQFNLNKRVVDFDNIGRDDEIPF